MILAFLMRHELKHPGRGGCGGVKHSGSRMSSWEEVETEAAYRARLAFLCGCSSQLIKLCCFSVPSVFSSLLLHWKKMRGRTLMGFFFCVLPLSSFHQHPHSVLPISLELAFLAESTRIASTSLLTSSQLAAVFVVVSFPLCIQHTSV